MLSYSVYLALRYRLLNTSVVKYLRGRSTCSIVHPQLVSPPRLLPDYIRKPTYVESRIFKSNLTSPAIKTQEQIEGMREACQVARSILDRAGHSLKVGMTTDEIDGIVHEECINNNCYPSPLMYKGFPKSVCTSVNNVACHGIPDSRLLEDGDIINVDVTVYYKGYHGDVSETYLVGNVDTDGQKLVRVAEECRDRGISVCKPGAQFSEIGIAIENHANSNGYNVIPHFTGHGIGEYFHEPPHIFHVGLNTVNRDLNKHKIAVPLFGAAYAAPNKAALGYYGEEEVVKKMEPGMTFTIEPIISEGSEEFKILEDKWTAVSVDNSRSAQFEHTILITDTGVEVLTK